MNQAKNYVSTINIFIFGCGLILLQNHNAISTFINKLLNDENKPQDKKDRRGIRRERRSSPRTMKALNKKPNYRKLFLNKSSKSQGWANKQIKLNRALASFQARRKIKIAIIDTGIDFNNPVLTKKISLNKGEMGLDKNGNDKRFNNIDDDKNGFVDDFQGWDFANNDNTAQDIHGHGTHIAGIIVEGIEENTSIEILPIQFFSISKSSKENVRNTAKAIKYALQQGADIINYSAGGGQENEIERAAIQLAKENGVLIVTAAGNESSDNDQTPYYPANYQYSNILNVASVDSRRAKVKSSNYGIHSIDLFAPGHSIQSIGLNNTTKKLTGTSQATAFVTKVAALTLSAAIKPIEPEGLKQHLLDSSTKEPKLLKYSQKAKIINAEQSLRSLKPYNTNQIFVSDI